MSNIKQEILAAYDSIAEKYDECLWDDMPYNDYIDSFLTLLKGKNILDIGCAMGSFTKYVADKGYIVDGIDLSPKMIEIAKRKVSNVNFYVMDMTNIQIDKKYDGLMMINSTIHIPKSETVAMFKSFKNLLVDDGIIFIILQEGDGEKYVVEPLDPEFKEFVNFYRVEEIENVFNECGLEIIDKGKIEDYADFELGNNQLVYYLKKR